MFSRWIIVLCSIGLACAAFPEQSVETRLGRARAYLDEGRLDRALKATEAILVRDPGIPSAEVLDLHLKILSAQGRDRAAAAFSQWTTDASSQSQLSRELPDSVRAECEAREAAAESSRSGWLIRPRYSLLYQIKRPRLLEEAAAFFDLTQIGEIQNLSRVHARSAGIAWAVIDQVLSMRVSPRALRATDLDAFPIRYCIYCDLEAPPKEYFSADG